MYGREGRKETYCRRLSIHTRSHHMILMTIKASLFSLFQQPEQKKEQLKPGMGFHGVCDWCSILFRKNKHMLCYNRVHRRPRKQVRVRRPFEASDSRAPVVYMYVCVFLNMLLSPREANFLETLYHVHSFVFLPGCAACPFCWGTSGALQRQCLVGPGMWRWT